MKRLPADVRAYLVQDRTSDPLSLALSADEIFLRHVSFFSALNHPQYWGRSFLFMPSTLRLLLLLVLLLLVPILVVLLMLLQPLVGSTHSLCVGIPDLMVIRVRSVEFLVPGQETS